MPISPGSEPIDIVSSEGEWEVVKKREPGTTQTSNGMAKKCSNIYNKSCKCKKDNPFCLTNIIPAPGGYRKKGLWQRDSAALLTHGADPARLTREVGPLKLLVLDT